jgi:hypothetical protein
MTSETTERSTQVGEIGMARKDRLTLCALHIKLHDRFVEIASCRAMAKIIVLDRAQHQFCAGHRRHAAQQYTLVHFPRLVPIVATDVLHSEAKIQLRQLPCRRPYCCR